MTHPEHPSDDHLTGFEAALASLEPAPARPSAADVAYETGRRDALAAQWQALWIHRSLTAAAVVIAGLAGISTLTRPGSQPGGPAGPAIVENEADPQPHPALPAPRRELVAQGVSPTSPYSYGALRDALIEDAAGALDAAPLRAGPPGSGGATDVPSLADLLRAQRGM